MVSYVLSIIKNAVNFAGISTPVMSVRIEGITPSNKSGNMPQRISYFDLVCFLLQYYLLIYIALGMSFLNFLVDHV